ncbi:unnamed protein product [Polarella glacialis]|uniref:Uncharacterized protein n=1 Tax=Polarella glacialis TaxID=89957 RepID=A0A813KB46_POLGL|nr:unnamed protein product [Polarella glacialis]
MTAANIVGVTLTVTSVPAPKETKTTVSTTAVQAATTTSMTAVTGVTAEAVVVVAMIERQIVGQLMLVVDTGAATFVNDPASKLGAKSGIAKVASVGASQVSVIFTQYVRRLTGRQLQRAPAILVDFTITINRATLSEVQVIVSDLKTNSALATYIQQEIWAISSSSVYLIIVESVTAEVVTGRAPVQQIIYEQTSGSIKVAGSSWLVVGAIGLLLSRSRL